MTKKKYEALGDFVFIKRDAQKHSLDAIEISEKARIKNILGVVTSINKHGSVSIGDRVHVPHFNVQDYSVDGDEYAIVRQSELFAKEDGDATFLPINGYLKVRKCENDHVRDDTGEILIHQTDKFIETTNWVEIVDIAGDCVYFDKGDIGDFCIAPEYNQKLQRVEYTKDFMLHESVIEFTTGG